MKYIVTSLLNGKFNPCSNHESGIQLTGLVNVGVVEIARSGILDSPEEAFSVAEKVYQEEFERIKNDINEESGWYLCTYDSHDIWLCKDQEDTIYEEWIFSVNVMTMFDSQKEFDECEQRRNEKIEELKNLLKSQTDSIKIDYKSVVDRKRSRLF